MSSRNTYRIVDIAQTLLQSFPGANSGDSVRVSVYDITDNALDVDRVAMTFESGVTWSYAITFSQNNYYLATYTNETLDVSFFEYIKVEGSLQGVAGGSGTGTTLSNLRSRFLRLVDSYNANDLTGVNSSGDIADLCLNNGLQLIYSQLKASKFLQGYASTSLVSVAAQAYIELSGISDLDEIASMKDTANNISLQWVPPWVYFDDIPDPADDTGTPFQYTRIFNRVYLRPRPTSAITYTTEYIKNYARLSADADQALIPAKYDDWIYKEAKVQWYQHLEPENVGVIGLAIKERDEARSIYLGDALAGFNEVMVSESHWGRTGLRQRIYDSPIGS